MAIERIRHPDQPGILSLAQLEASDSLARVKGRRWLREQIKAGRLKAINTGVKRRAYYIEVPEWERFKREELKTAPSGVSA